MGGCGSKPSQAADDTAAQAAGRTGRAAAAAPEPAVQAAVHSDIVNDVTRGGTDTEIISSSEDGSCVLYDWRRGKVVRSAASHSYRPATMAFAYC